MAAQNVTAQLLEEYKNSRLQEGAANATVNRELAASQTAFRIAKKSGKLRHLPGFPHLKENKKRTGFITDAAYSRLTALATELWLRLWLELAYTYGWRSGELRGLKISQVDLASKTIRLEGSQSKNGQPRVVAMTKNVFELVKQPVVGKSPDDRLLTRQGNKPIGDFRKAWWKIAVKAGLGKWACRA